LTEDELRAVHALLFGLAVRISGEYGELTKRDCREGKVEKTFRQTVGDQFVVDEIDHHENF
jgi:hypothetical protein